jgi:cation transport regulator ChaB
MVTQTAPAPISTTGVNTKAICPISGVFKTQSQVHQIIHQLLREGISREEISVIGKDWESETRISGFLSRKDVIVDGLKTGAIFGSLFGSFLSLLTGVGVLFIPFVGSVVAAGPLGAALLGATSGGIIGSAGAGLVAALVSLGMPKDKATIYQTRIKAGEFLLVAEVPAVHSDKIQDLFKAAGGEEITACPEMRIPRQASGNLNSTEDLSPEIRSHLSEPAQQEFLTAYNLEFDKSEDENQALNKAWAVIEEKFERDDRGNWSRSHAA